MNKNAIKKFATDARRELISRVGQRALKYGISDKEIGNPKDDSVNGHLLSSTEKKQRAALIEQIKEKGYEQVMEEVAYTWFNRFSALRFMEVNGYLPTRVRVFTDENNAFKPQILTEAIHMELDGLDMEKVYAYKEANDNDELYKYLLITQCNALNSVLPGMFQKIADYTELLFPDNLLREGSVVQQMIELIPQEDWDIKNADSDGESQGQVQIIGWLYQYYISEKHDEVVDPLHGKVVQKEEIPAATQLFTTDWVVKYIIDNSLGRYWVERNPESALREQLKYFVAPKSGGINVVNENVSPEDITFFDPCMGSAHFGLYAFEVFMRIYIEYGYSERDAASLIMQKNIFGVDIDDRAAQLAYFALMMKACQYDRRFLKRGIKPHIYAIPESNIIDDFTIDYFSNGNQVIKDNLIKLIEDFKDAKEYGSTLQLSDIDFSLLLARMDEIEEDVNIGRELTVTTIKPILEVACLLKERYTIVATNPPYLNKYDATLKKYISDNYKDYAGDLFSVFMYRNFGYCQEGGYSGFMTPFLWMFIKTYEKLRLYIINNKSIATLVQMEYSAYEEATVPICAVVFKNKKDHSNGLYLKLSEFTGGMDVQKKKVLEGIRDSECTYFYSTSVELFKKIPGTPIAFWGTQAMADAFESSALLNEVANPRQGLITGDVNRFVRKWYECSETNLNLHAAPDENAREGKWFPYCNGGGYRKWYGNNDDVVNWLLDGLEVKGFVDDKGRQRSRPQNQQYYFHEGGTWSAISSSLFSIRYFPEGHLFSNAGMALYASHEDLLYIIGFLNSNLCQAYLGLFNEGLNYNQGDIAKLPIMKSERKKEIVSVVEKLVEYAKNDWDSIETSWDFERHPLIDGADSIENAYLQWEKECAIKLEESIRYEEMLNRLFLEIYNLTGEISPVVEERRVALKRADRETDIKSFISYAVGCMFGRYSLDVDGLAYAGGEWDDSKYSSFAADKDNIIPISDDEYFEDDIVGRFVKFVEVVYGKDTLQENLKFIADALGGKGQPKDVIRNYFMNGFYADHCKTYQKRPIYWMFDSGKKNGFKCLIYMHRYQPDTIARIRTDYVHEQQARYRTAIADLETRIANASTSERVKLNKQLKTLNDQATEIHEYEEKIHHLADQMISIDLDDGVKKNYEIFKDVLAKIK